MADSGHPEHRTLVQTVSVSGAIRFAVLCSCGWVAEAVEDAAPAAAAAEQHRWQPPVRRARWTA